MNYENYENKNHTSFGWEIPQKHQKDGKNLVSLWDTNI